MSKTSIFDFYFHNQFTHSTISLKGALLNVECQLGMNKLVICLTILSGLMLSVTSLRATHIVGGEMTYECPETTSTGLPCAFTGIVIPPSRV
ncbi:MAG: hypothetical protein IPJ06_19920 [Saprospiraceae bacterium]|nr:hypothetical protein [Saprospiraceae bacterium]